MNIYSVLSRSVGSESIPPKTKDLPQWVLRREGEQDSRKTNHLQLLSGERECLQKVHEAAERAGGPDR